MQGNRLVRLVQGTALCSFFLLALAGTQTDHWLPLPPQPSSPPSPPPPAALHHEQTIAVVSLDNNNRILKCSLILAETIDGFDKREILARLARHMEVRAVTFRQMVELVEGCKVEGAGVGQVVEEEVRETSLADYFTVTNGIMPGTLWCGVDDIADSYKNLGQLWQVDTCCRAHDHCPVKVKRFQTRYGVTNYSPYTKSHCTCDQLFFSCLKGVNSTKAETVGKFYFNLANIECMESRVVKTCLRREEIQRREGEQEGDTGDRKGRGRRQSRGGEVPAGGEGPEEGRRRTWPLVGLAVAAGKQEEPACLQWGERRGNFLVKPRLEF